MINLHNTPVYPAEPFAPKPDRADMKRSAKNGGPSGARSVLPRLRSRARRAATWAPLAALVAFLVYWPIVVFEVQSFTGEGSGAMLSVFSEPGTLRAVAMTFKLAAADVAIAVLLGTGLAFCAARVHPRWRAVAAIVPLVPLVVPAIAAVIGWIFLLSPRVGYINTLLRELPFFSGARTGPFDIYSFTGIVFVSALLFASFIFLFVSNALKTMGKDLEEAAAVAGASQLRIFLTVTLPQLRPALAYSGGVVALLALGQFSTVILLSGTAGIDVLTTKMFAKFETFPVPFAEVAALGIPLLLAGVGVMVLQQLFVGDMRRYVSVGGRAQQPAAHAARWWATAAIGAYGVLAVVLPLASLLYTALSPFWSGALRFDTLTLRNFASVLSNPYLLSAFYTTTVAAVATVVIVLPLGYLAARILAGRTTAPSAVVKGLDITLLMTYAFPAILFGFALLFAYTRPPFMLYGTKTLIIIAYCTIMIPYAARLILAQLIALGPEPWEASVVSGASNVRTFLQVTLPLLRRSAAAAAAVICILLFQEFGVSLLVRSASVQVVGGVLYDQYLAGSYPNVAVIALLMVLVAVAGVSSLLLVGGGDALKKLGSADRS
ncbi:MAG TPA: iron ABC transporter permease [Ramlibacter sp.]|nr:iron ABC transporter permease [Ramlibacter sp.]